MPVYLLHFEQPLAHAQHYLGHTDDLEERLVEHAENRGARLIKVINQLGIDWSLERIWEGGNTLKRQLKNRKNNRKLCPACTGKGRNVTYSNQNPNPKLTQCQALVGETLRRYFGGEVVGPKYKILPKEIFPGRNAIDNAKRRRLRTLAERGLLAAHPDYPGYLVYYPTTRLWETLNRRIQ